MLWGEKRACLHQTPADLGETTAAVLRLRKPRLVATVISLLIFLLPETGEGGLREAGEWSGEEGEKGLGQGFLAGGQPLL